MGRGLLILLGLLVVTWFEFEVYPGHSYLQGETQLLVPMLERLDTPGFLSRDLVASNPTFAYTIYDEITQSLHTGAQLSFENALQDQQLLFRFVGIFGLFLLARSLKVAPFSSLVLSGAVNAITHLVSPEAFVTNPEATPVSFALALVFLAAGALVSRAPLLAGLAGGLALLYDPMTAAQFWLIVLAIWLFQSRHRKFLRPVWPPLLIFALILGNLVQLQAGLGVGQDLTARMSTAMVQLVRWRTPWVWVSDWAPTGILSYLFLAVAGLWALARLRHITDRLMKWTALGLLASGFLSVAFALLLLANKSQFAVEMMPARNLALTVAVAALLCGAASWHAAQQRKWGESLPWMVLLIAAILNGQVLDLLHGKTDAIQHHSSTAAVRELAQWANQNTWGSSLFQFPEAGRGNEPGIFRALSKRALWADWQSGLIADYSEAAGLEWQSRWQARLPLHEMLPLPIDYYVVDRARALAGVKPAFLNSVYVVYDAQDLRESRASLPNKP